MCLKGWSWIAWQDLKYGRLREMQIKWSIVDLHCLEQSSMGTRICIQVSRWITVLEGSSFSMISSNESSDLKFSDLVGTCTEKSDVLLSRVSVIKMAKGTKICVFVIHGLHMDVVKTGVLLSTCLLLQHIVKHILLHNVLQSSCVFKYMINHSANVPYNFLDCVVG